MSSISGIKAVVNNSVSQTNALKCKGVICTNDISGNTIVGTPSTYLKNITSNVQDQLNSIIAYDTNNTTTINSIQSQLNSITSTSTSGGGYFTVVCERLGHASGNTFGFGAGLYNSNEIVLPACTLIMSRCTASQSLANGTAYYNFYKNGVATSVSTGIYVSTSANTVTHNLTFASGDTFKIVTVNSGNYTTNTTVQLRINLIFQSVGIKGADGISPTITIGTTSTVASGVNASVVNSGTSTNQILNFSIPRGIQGERGYAGITPLLSIGSVINLASGSTPYVNFDATSTDTNKIFNFGLVSGITPTFSIGSVVASSSPYVSFDSASTTTNKILNFGIVNGTNGTNGIDAGDIGNAVGTAAVFIALQAQVSTLQGQMSTLNLITIPAIDAQLTTLDSTTTDLTASVGNLETDVDGILTKLINVVKTTDALQVKSKFQIINTGVNPLSGAFSNVLSSFDPIANTITLGRTGTTNTIDGNTINMGTLLTTTTMNLNGTTINIGENLLSAVGTTVNIEANNIYMGTAGYLNNVYIGNNYSNVRIQSMTGSAINVGNFLDQFA
jgi:hypothetical protein